MTTISLKIPEERMAVLIGKDGKTKKQLEDATKTKILINEDVSVQGESLGPLLAREVIKAIGRGFSPDKAFHLLREGWQLDVISLRGESQKTIKRLLGRVIGKMGSIKKYIEDINNVYISVYGKTISVIGKWEDVSRASQILEDLLAGRSHSYVLWRMRKQKKSGQEKAYL